MTGPSFFAFTPEALTAWRRGIDDRIVAPAAKAKSLTTIGPVAAVRREIALSRLLTGVGDRSFEIAKVSLGDAIQIVMLAAEPSAAHAKAVARALLGAWPIGYLGDVFGYLPTSAQVGGRQPATSEIETGRIVHASVP